MKPRLAFLAWAAVFAALGAALPTWPSAVDELEDIMFLHSGYRSRNFAEGVTPCSFSEFGAGRIAAAEWIRTAFHDMATANTVQGTGGLDASLNYETDRAENGGQAFKTTLTFMSSFYSSRSSLSDLIALALSTAVRSCAGPTVPVRAGRIDAQAAGNQGIPLPQNAIGTFENQFLRMGFNTAEMIQLVACGHTVGGVHASTNPDIVPPGSTANDYKLFDGTSAFDSKEASDYVTDQSQDPLVTGPALKAGKASDLRVFAADGNATIATLANPGTFASTCSSILQRMIEVVPAGVVLTDPVQPYEVKPSALQLTLLPGGTTISFVGEIRIRTTVRTASQIASVKLVFKHRNGGNACGGCTITTTVAGTAAGFEDSFVFYKFSSTLPSLSSISSFNVLVTLTTGTTETHDNNGVGYLVEDSIIFQNPQSCLAPGLDPNGKNDLTIVAAIRSGLPASPVSLTLSVKVVTPGAWVPPIQTIIQSMVKGPSVGPYDLYSAGYPLDPFDTLTTTFDVSVGTGIGKLVDAFKHTGDLGTTCASLGGGTSSTTSATTLTSGTSTTQTSSSTSVSATPTGPVNKPKIKHYKYYGCHTDTNSKRALSGAVHIDDSMTNEKCAAFCHGYKFFGTEYGRECYCGNKFTSGVSTPIGDCSVTCPGDISEYCGAGFRLTVYIRKRSVSSIHHTGSSTTTSSATSTPTLGIKPIINNYNYLGCQTDAVEQRALSALSTSSDGMTLELCAGFCRGYKFWGTEYGRECYCGNTLDPSSTIAPVTECASVCGGNPLEYCGAGYRLSVYQLQ